MNEINAGNLGARHSAEPTAATVGNGSAAGKVVDKGTSSEGVVQRPSQDGAVGKQREDVEQARVEQAVAQMNEFIQSNQRDLQFNVDDGSGHVVVSVLERSTGELIRQIPNEDFLQMARALKDNDEINLIAISS